MSDWPFAKTFSKPTAWIRYVGCWLKAQKAPRQNPVERARLQRFELQTLEPRFLLSVSQPSPPAVIEVPFGATTNVTTPLSTQAVASLRAGVGGLADFLTAIASYDKLTANLPILDQSIGTLLSPGTAIKSVFADGIVSYLDTTVAPTVEGLTNVIKTLGGTFGDLTLTLNANSVTGTSNASEVLFGLTLNLTRANTPTPATLGQAGLDLGLTTGSASVSPQSHLALQFSFGFDQTAGLSSEDAFFVRVQQLTGDVQVTGLPNGFALNAGLLGATVQTPTLSMIGKVGVTVLNPDHDAKGNVTLKELRTTALGSLVTMAPAQSLLTGSLPVSAGTVGGFTFPGAPAIAISGDPVAGKLTLTANNDFKELQNFTTLTASSFISVLNQVAGRLSGLSASSLLGTLVPFLGGSTVGDVVDFGNLLKGAISGLADSNGVPTFGTVQELTAKLSTLLGITSAALSPTYNAATNEFSLQLTFHGVAAPATVDLDLGSIINSNASSGLNGFSVLTDDAKATLNATGDLSLKLVMNLTPPVATQLGGVLPSNGRLTAPVSLLLGTDIGTTVTLTVPADATNNTAADLIADINAQINASVLKGKVIASLQGTTLLLSTTTFGANASLLGGAAVGNALGLPESFMALDTLAQHSFIDTPSLSASVTLASPKVTGTATEGSVGLLITDGTASASAGVSLALKSGAPTRIAVYEDNPTDLATLFNTTVTGTANAVLKVKANGSGFSATGTPTVTVAWPNITNAAELTASFNSDFSTTFGKYGNLSITQVIDAIKAVRDRFVALSSDPLMTQTLPIIGQRMSDVINVADMLNAFISSLDAQAPTTVQDLQRLLNVALAASADTTQGLMGTSSATVDFTGGVLSVNLKLVKSLTASLPAVVDLSQLGQTGVDQIGDGAGSDPVAVQLGVAATIKVGVDLSGASPSVFVNDASQLEFGVKASDTSVNFTSLIGAASFNVTNGSVSLDDGTVTHGPAKISFALPATGNHRYTLASFGSATLAGAAVGKSSAQLPIDNAGSSLGFISLSTNATTPLNFFNYTVTGPGSQIANLAHPAQVTTVLGSIQQGLNNFLGWLNNLIQSKILLTPLPGIDPNLGLQAQNWLTGVQQQINTALANPQATADGVRLAIANALIQPDPIFGLVWLGDISGDNQTTNADVNLFVGPRAASGSGLTAVPALAAGEIYFRLKLDPHVQPGFPAPASNVPLSSQGLPMIPIRLAALMPNNSLPLTIVPGTRLYVAPTLSLDLAFGLSTTDGFFIDTTQQDELQITLEVQFGSLVPTATNPSGAIQTAAGSLGGLQGQIEFNQSTNAQDTDNRSRLFARLKVDLRDPTDPSGTIDHRITGGDLLRLINNPDLRLRSFSVKADAETRIRFIFQIGFDQKLLKLPSFLVDFNFDYNFSNVPVVNFVNGPTNADISAFLANAGLPSVSFENVRLGVGSLIRDFVNPILTTVNNILQPIRPVIDALNTRIEALELNPNIRAIFDKLPFGHPDGQVTLLDVLAWSRALPQGALDFLLAVRAIDNLVRAVPSVPQEIMLNFGSFGLGTADLRSDVLQNILPSVIQSPALSILDQIDAITGAIKTFFDSIFTITPGHGFKFQMLDQLTAGKILFGQTVDIFSYDMPTLTASMSLERVIPVFGPLPPVSLNFGGSISASAHFTFGFDTSGLQTGSIEDGFYLKADKNDPPFVITGNIHGGAAVGIPGLAEVRGELNLNAVVKFRLNDPNKDGKLNVSEFKWILAQGNFFDLFDIGGKIWAQADIKATLLGYTWRLDSPEFVFWDPDKSKPVTTGNPVTLPDRLEGNDTRETAAPIGVGPGIHLRGASIGKFNDQDWYSFQVLKPLESLDVQVVGLAAVDVEVYDANGVPIGFARTDSTSDVVTTGTLSAATYYVHVISHGGVASYDLNIDNSYGTNTKVYYVNLSSVTDATKNSYYTTAKGDDANDGTTPGFPKATIQAIFDQYTVLPGDTVVVDSGAYSAATTISGPHGGGNDQGFILAGAPGGRTVLTASSGIALTLNNVGLEETSPQLGTMLANFKFEGNSTSIRLSGVENSTFANLQFSSITGDAFEMYGTTESIFDNIKIQNAHIGFEVLASSNGNTFSNLNITAVAAGLALTGSNTNTITDSTIAASLAGVNLVTSNSNHLTKLTLSGAGLGVQLVGADDNELDHLTVTSEDTSVFFGTLVPQNGAAIESHRNSLHDSAVASVVVEGVNNEVKTNVVSGDVKVKKANLARVQDNMVTGAIAVEESSSSMIVGNTVAGGISVSGGNADIVDTNVLTQSGVTILGGNNVIVRNNQINGAGIGVQIGGLPDDPAGVTVQGNTISGYDPGTTNVVGVRGIDLLTGDSTGVDIHHNTITGFANYGIYAPSDVSIHDNTISGSGTGVEFGGASESVYHNDIFNNVVGLSGSGLLGLLGWSANLVPNDIHDNDIGIQAKSNGTVQYNKVRNNRIGIMAGSGANVHNNIVYNSTEVGIMVDGTSGVSLVNNTVYAPQGDAVRVVNGSQNVTLKNNILWALGGFDLYVATNSQTGFASDYNNLFTTGTGRAVWYQKDFTDIFDWQVEAGFDLHSIGSTVPAGALDNPQFVNLAGADFHLASNSTSIDAADPATPFSIETGFNGGRADLGAYGNTAQATPSRSQYLQMLYPVYYTDWEVGGSNTITWRDYDANSIDHRLSGTLRVELWEGSTKLRDIATVDITNGQFSWAPDVALSDTNRRYFIKLVKTDNAAVTERQRENFAVPVTGIYDYFVNDSSTANGQYTTAVGNNRNTGKTAGDPKANLLPIVLNYDLRPRVTGNGTSQAVVHVDTGNYINVRDLVFSGDIGSGLGDDEGMTITGPTDPNKVATIDRAKAIQGARVMELNNADQVVIAHLTLVGAERGIWVHNGSESFQGSYLTLSGHTQEGLLIGPAGYSQETLSSGASALDHLTAFNNGGDGIAVTYTGGTALDYNAILVHDNGGNGLNVAAPLHSLTNSVAYHNTKAGFNLTGYSNGPAALIYGNEAYGNQTGLYVNQSAIIGDQDLALGRGNQIHDNSYQGIYAPSASVYGNVVYGQTSTSGAAIVAGLAASNVVYSNSNGIQAGTARNNRVFHNAGVGIEAQYALGNVVYSNAIGVKATYNASGNLIYANSTAGLLFTYGGYNSGAGTIQNNTIYQTNGDAVQITGTRTVVLRNNILWAENGYAVNVDKNSQAGFDSDFNLFYFTAGGNGKVGYWQGAVRGTFAGWKGATFGDKNSIFADPLFVDKDGADNMLGYLDATQNGFDDDFHLQSTFGSLHNGTLAPVLVNGLPANRAGTLTNDAAQSPAIDRGDFRQGYGDYANEPANNGSYVDLGSYGNTVQASRSPQQFVLVTSPDGGDVFPKGQTFNINWRSFDTKHDPFNPPAGGNVVTIQLLKAGAPVLTIASNAPNSGTYAWLVPDSLALGTDYAIQVTHQSGSLLTDTSNAQFSITPKISVYYINDNTVDAGDLTTVVGDDTVDGLSPVTPMASLRALLEKYDLGPNDVIRVDAGHYLLTANTIITNQDSGVTIEGFYDPAHPEKQSIIDRNETSSSSAFAIDLQNADDVTLSHLTISGAYAGVYANDYSGSENLTIRDSNISNNYYYGVWIKYGNAGVKLLGNNFSGDRTNDGGPTYNSNDNQYQGVEVDSEDAFVSGNVFHDGSLGYTTRATEGLIQGNEFHHLSSAIAASAQYGGATNVVIRGNVLHDNTGGISAGSGVLIDSNTFTHNAGVAISATGNDPYGLVRVFNNTITDQFGNGAKGIAASSALVRGNTIADGVTGIDLSGTGRAEGNIVYNQSTVGITGSGSIIGNTVYGSGIGISVSGGSYGSTTTPVISNNVVYNNLTEGFEIRGNGLLVTQNTIYQTTGDGVTVSNSGNITLTNNIIVVTDPTRSALNVNTDSQAGFASDYNLFWGGAAIARWQGQRILTQADWAYEIGFDRHSLVADPKFIDADGADGVLGYVPAVDTTPAVNGGADDNFHLQASSPAIDAGAPGSAFLLEPGPNGGRANLGSYGNTAQAATSAAQTIQLLTPSDLDRLISGRTTTITWRSSGLAEAALLAQVNIGGSAVGGWAGSDFAVEDYTSASISGAVDVSSMASGVPADIFKSYQIGSYDSANPYGLDYSLPVADGTYTIRLYFVDPDTNSNLTRKMDVVANGTTLQAGLEVKAEAGGALKALVKTYTVTASGGTGIHLSLNNVGGSAAILSGLQLVGSNVGGAAGTTVSLESSIDNGATWSTIASSVPLGQNGSGSYDWTPGAETAGKNVFVRIKSNASSQPSDVTGQAIYVAPAGHTFYVNAALDANDYYTTAAGSNLASGADAAHPMSSIYSLLQAYQLGAGDRILVDSGTYQLLNNIILTKGDSGVQIVGAPNFQTVLDRSNPNSGATAVFELRDADNVSISGLKITGASAGIFAADGADADGVAVSNNIIFGNNDEGIASGVSNDRWLIANNQFFGVQTDNSYPNSNYQNNQDTAVETKGSGAIIRANSFTQQISAGDSETTIGTAISISSGDALVENNSIRNYSTGVTFSYSSTGALGPQSVIRNNEIAFGDTGIYVTNGNVLITGNTVHDNSSQGIGAGNYYGTNSSIVVEGNTVFGNAGSGGSGFGISAQGGVLVRNNVVYGNATGLYATNSSVNSNRIFGNTVVGISAFGGTQISGNSIYSNAIGLQASYYNSSSGGGFFPAFFTGTIANNIIYDNSDAGLVIDGGSETRVINNTFLQLAGTAIRVLGSDYTYGSGSYPNYYTQTIAVPSTDIQIRNNIFVVGTSTALDVDKYSQVGFASDYNLFSVGSGRIANWQGASLTSLDGWFYGLGQDQHSKVGDPLFSNQAGNDGLLGYRNGTDFGLDDNFRVQAGSPTVDAGDPASYYFAEPAPNGGRVNLGAYGNTSQTPASSTTQTLTVTSPSLYDKAETGSPVTITWNTSGLTQTTTILQMNAGGDVVGSWGYGAFTTNASYSYRITDPVNRSGVANPAPQEVYQSYQGGLGALAYHFDLPNGTYTLRLQFVEPDTYYGNGNNHRTFDIVAQGETLASDYEIAARAGGSQKAVAETYTVTVNGGRGLDLVLGDQSHYAVISAIDITKANPLGGATATANVEVSTDNGATWSSVAQGAAMDASGSGSAQWTPPANAAGLNAIFRVTANQGSQPRAISQPLQLASAGTSFYINDGATSGDVFSTAIGNDANDGKDPARPMRTLAALLDAYDLNPGDRIFVDAGTYNLLRTVLLTLQDSGVEIIGPSASAAAINRGNSLLDTAVIELQGADDVKLTNLSLTGAAIGVRAADGAGSDRLQITGNTIFGNAKFGVYAGSGNLAPSITNSNIYGVPGGTAADDQPTGIEVHGVDAVISGNQVHDGKIGIKTAYNQQGDTLRARIANNEVYNNSDTGIAAATYASTRADWIVVTGNLVHDNGKRGIEAANNVLVSNNTVRAQNTANAVGIYLYNGEVSGNYVFGNTIGIDLQGPGLVAGNRVVANLVSGIRAVAGTISGNSIYSNAIGIDIPSGGALVTNNLIYANTDNAITVLGSLRATNNTIRQTVGDAIRLLSNGYSSNGSAVLRNNILWVDAGIAIDATGGSLGATDSDYNLFYITNPTNAHLGYNGTNRNTLADWQTATAMDAHSVAGDPKFLDADGADNILGYQILNGNPVDGGADDNFHLQQTSPAIDRADGLHAPGADNENLSRKDAIGIANAGSDDYVVSTPASNYVATGGDQVSFSNSGYGSQSIYYASLNLGFTFSYFGQNYTSVVISPNGFLSFSSSDVSDRDNSVTNLGAQARIAPFWEDFLGPNVVYGSVYKTVTATSATVRWESATVHFSVTLMSNGNIRFDYGAGNTGYAPTVGISNGGGVVKVAPVNGQASFNNASAVLYTFTANGSVTDLGASEFQGSGADATVPTIVGSTPPEIQLGTARGIPFSSFALKFSEALDSINARQSLFYTLARDTGTAGFDGNDQVYPLTAAYVAGSDTVTLTVRDGVLPIGSYRLIISGGSVFDQSGNALAAYTKDFTVNNHGVELSTNSLNVNEAGSTTVGIRLREAPGAGQNVVVTVAPKSGGDASLTVSGATTFTFTSQNWNVFQTATIAAAADADAANGTTEFTVTAPGWTGDSVIATEQDDDRVLQVDKATVSVGENSNAQSGLVGIRLAAQPGGNVVVTIQRTAGDSDLSVSDGTTLIFTPANWNVYQQATIFAADDADASNGSATFTATADGWANAGFTATETDDDFRIIVGSQFSSQFNIGKGATTTLAVSLAGKPDGNVNVSTVGTGGSSSITLTGGAALVFTPDNWDVPQLITFSSSATANFRDTANFNATATGWSSAGFSVKVTPPDGTILVDPDVTKNLNQNSGGQYLSIGYPELVGSNQQLTITINTLPANATLSIYGSPVTLGTVLDAFDLAYGGLTVRPANGFLGNAGVFKYTVSDGQGQSAAQSITFNVTRPNTTPYAGGDPQLTVVKNGTKSLGLNEPFDPDAGEVLTLRVDSIPNGAKGSVKVGVNGRTLQVNDTLTSSELTSLVFVPATDFLGQAGSFTFTVTDALGASDSATATFNVVDALNTPPVVQGDKALVTSPGGTVPLAISAPFDADGDALTIKVTSVPSATLGVVKLPNGTILGAQAVIAVGQLQQLTFTAAAGATSGMSGAFSYQASDGHGGSDTQTISLGVVFAVNFDKSKPFVYIDGNGDKVTVTFGGAGSATALFASAPVLTGTAPGVDLDSIVLSGTTSATTLKVAVAKQGAVGTAQTTIKHVATLAGQQSLKSLTFAPGVTLGDGVAGSAPALLVSGSLSTLALDDVAANASVLVGDGYALVPADRPKIAALKVVFTADDVGDGASFVINGGVTSATIGSWSNGTLRATQSIGAVTLKRGDTALALTANSGESATVGKLADATMGAVSLPGAFLGTIFAQGKLTSFTARGAFTPLASLSAASSGAVSAGNFTGGTITARTGDLAAVTTTTGTMANLTVGVPLGKLGEISVKRTAVTGALVGMSSVTVNALKIGGVTATLAGTTGFTSGSALRNSHFTATATTPDAIGQVTASVTGGSELTFGTGSYNSTFTSAGAMGAYTVTMLTKAPTATLNGIYYGDVNVAKEMGAISATVSGTDASKPSLPSASIAMTGMVFFDLTALKIAGVTATVTGGAGFQTGVGIQDTHFTATDNSATAFGKVAVTLTGGAVLTTGTGVVNSAFTSNGNLGTVTVSATAAAPAAVLTGFRSSIVSAGHDLGAVSVTANGSSAAPTGGHAVGVEVNVNDVTFTAGGNLASFTVVAKGAGGLNQAIASGTGNVAVSATGSIGAVTLTASKSKLSNSTAYAVRGLGITSGTTLGALKVSGDATAGQVSSLHVYAGGAVKSLDISAPTKAFGSMSNSVILAGQKVAFTVTTLAAVSLGTVTMTGDLTNTKIAAAGNLGAIKIGGAVSGSYFIAGVLTGGDHTLLTGDDSYHVYSAIATVAVTGAFTTSTIASGINPGADYAWGGGTGLAADVRGGILPSAKATTKLASIGAIKVGAASATGTMQYRTPATLIHTSAVEAVNLTSVQIGTAAARKDFTVSFWIDADGQADEDASETIFRSL